MGSLVLPRQRDHTSEGSGRRAFEAVPEDPRHASVHVALLQKASRAAARLAGDRARRPRHRRELSDADGGDVDAAHGGVKPLTRPSATLSPQAGRGPTPSRSASSGRSHALAQRKLREKSTRSRCASSLDLRPAVRGEGGPERSEGPDEGTCTLLTPAVNVNQPIGDDVPRILLLDVLSSRLAH